MHVTVQEHCQATSVPPPSTGSTWSIKIALDHLYPEDVRLEPQGVKVGSTRKSLNLPGKDPVVLWLLAVGLIWARGA